MVTTSRSVAHRLARHRPRRWLEPIISPYLDRLMRAAQDGHTCQRHEVTGFADLARGERVFLDEHGAQHAEPID